MTKDLDLSLEGADVLIVEDIVDTGVTLTYLAHVLQQRRPRSIQIAALLDKPSRRCRCKSGMSGLRFPMNSSWVLGWITPTTTGILRDICVIEE